MRRREDGWGDGWDDGRADRGNDGWQDGPAEGAYGSDRDGNGYTGAGYNGAGSGGTGHNGTGYNEAGHNGGGYRGDRYNGGGYSAGGYQGQGYGGPEHPGYAAQSYGGQAPGRVPGQAPVQAPPEVTRVDRGIGDSGYDAGYRQQPPNLQRPAGAPAEFSPGDNPSAPARPRTPRPYGRLSIFTLLDDRTAEFDRLAEEAAEGVRTSEPDTLVYVIHVVPKAPMQRIIYEIYRDRAAFENHESQPHIQRFTEARKPCVLATNIIDLRLKYAKVAALFQGEAASGRPVEQDPWPEDGAEEPRPPRRTPRALEQHAGQHGGTGQYAGAGQYGGGGQYGGASQYGGGGAHEPDGQYNGPDQYQRYGESDRAYPGAQRPKPPRPPWEDEPEWAPSPHPGQRYGG